LTAVKIVTVTGQKHFPNRMKKKDLQNRYNKHFLSIRMREYVPWIQTESHTVCSIEKLKGLSILLNIVFMPPPAIGWAAAALCF